MTYTIDYIRKNDLIIFSAKMGSHAYGTFLPTSDVDLRGVFIQPLKDILKYGYVDQVADDTNDIVFYELKRFLELVEKNNPNILELLNAPEDCVIYRNAPLYSLIEASRSVFITKKCRYTFAGYAIAQIKKARGYNKKMNWDERAMERKTVLDFCYIVENGKTIPFNTFLQSWNWKALNKDTYQDFGLAKVDHAHDVYAMYRMQKMDGGGIVSDPETANDVQLMSIPKNKKIVENRAK